MQRFMRLAAAAVIGLGALPARAQAPAPADTKPIEVRVPDRKEPVRYSEEIADFMDSKCVGCHGSILAESRLNLESVAGMQKGGKRGPALVPGRADDSLLFKMAAHRVKPAMPPVDKPASKPLAPEELGLLKLWIDAGAHDDTSESGAGRKERPSAIELGELPPGVHPINAVDMTGDGARVAAGRANVVQVYDVDSGLEIIALGGHKDLIQSVRFSPDGTMLAAGSYQKVTLWNVPSGRLLKRLPGHSGPIGALVVAADGVTAYSAGDDKTIRAWNLEAGTLVRTMAQPAGVTALALLPAPGGPQIMSGGRDGVVRCGGAGGGEVIALGGHSGPVNDIAVLDESAASPRAVSVSDDGTARIWLVAAGRSAAPKAAGNGQTAAQRSSPQAIVVAASKQPLRCVAVTPDRQAIVTAGDDGTVRVWNARDGSPVSVRASGHAGAVLAVAISPDGRFLLTGSADNTARLHRLDKGVLGLVRVLGGHRGPVRHVAFSPRGDQVATAGAEGGIKIWDAATGDGVIALGHTPATAAAVQTVQKIAFSGDGRLVSASADGSLCTWGFSGTWASFRTLEHHVFRVLALDFSPDGKMLATGGGEPSRSGEVKLWEIGKGLLARSLSSLHSDTVFGLRFSPDGAKLASASADKFLKVTSLADGKLLRSYEGHTHHVMAVDWRSDGKQLASGGADSVIKVWDYDLGEQIRTLQPAGKQITSLRWLAGKPEIVGASGDAQVRVWNADNGGIARVYAGAADYIFGVAASVDGARVTGGGADGVLFVWNGQNGQVVRRIEPPHP